MHNRKIIRLPDYDYSKNGAYFITICTHKRKNLFGAVGADLVSARMVADIFEKTITAFSGVSSPKYVVMPNHFHAIIVMDRADTRSAPTLMQIMQAFKSRTTVAYIQLVQEGRTAPFEGKLWQRSFYDHVIRNEKDYLEIWQYIENNPLKRELDRFYTQE